MPLKGWQGPKFVSESPNADSISWWLREQNCS